MWGGASILLRAGTCTVRAFQIVAYSSVQYVSIGRRTGPRASNDTAGRWDAALRRTRTRELFLRARGGMHHIIFGSLNLPMRGDDE